MLIIKNGKRKTTEGRELPNQENIGTLGENESYSYLVISETDSINQMKIKEKYQKSSEEQENFLKANSVAEI